MNREDIKNILISMINDENNIYINELLTKVDSVSEEELELRLNKIGNDEESIRKYFEEQLSKRDNNRHEEHTPINKMFTYGTTGNCIHLHMPVLLQEMIAQIGIKKTIDTVNLYMLDAIEKIKDLRNSGFDKFQDKDSIYMISPILVGKEMKFLEELDFEIKSYKKKELRDEQFVLENKEAMLAVSLFGKECNIGSAKISLEVINQDKWQDKRKRKIEEFKKQGIVLEEENKEIGFRETLASLTNSEDEIVFMPSENTNQVEKNINQRDESIK